MSTVAPAGYFVPGYHETMPETKNISLHDSESSLFENILDVINPLQHLPGVSTLYRAITGDEISAPARLVGGALYGGPLGFASAAANLAFEEATGGDLADHAMALVGDAIDTPVANETALANRANASANQLAATDPAATGRAIVWSGPRVLPSLARVETAAPAADAAQISNAGSVAGRPGATVAADGTAQPAWLNAAIADAQSVQYAAQLGEAPQPVAAQPWITEAMLDALGKYETMARQRNR